MSVKRLVEFLIKKAGYEIHAQWRMGALAHARKLAEIFDRFQIEYVLDVGANQNQFRDFLRTQVGFSGVIHSFEPIAELVSQMKSRKDGDSAWLIHECALGAEEGRRQFNIMASNTFSSFLEPAYEAVPEFTPLNTVVSQEMVAVRTLDSFIAGLGKQIDLKRTFLKLDTQGFDLEVVKGGERSVAEIPALQTEVSILPIYRGMPTWTESLAAFSTMGFTISDMFLVTSDQSLRATEFDCVMVKA